MTIAQYLELAAYWQKYPPTHLLLRAALGYKGAEIRTGDLTELIAAVAGGGIHAKS